MIELWKLPKTERAKVREKELQLRTEIEKINDSIVRHKNQLASEEWMLSQKQIELEAIQNKHNLHD